MNDYQNFCVKKRFQPKFEVAMEMWRGGDSISNSAGRLTLGRPVDCQKELVAAEKLLCYSCFRRLVHKE